MISYYHCRSQKMSLAVDLRNVSENLEAEILNNLKSVKHILKGRLPLNFVSVKFKELLTEKHRDRLVFNTIVAIYMLSFFKLFSLMCTLFLSWIYGNLSSPHHIGTKITAMVKSTSVKWAGLVGCK